MTHKAQIQSKIEEYSRRSEQLQHYIQSRQGTVSSSEGSCGSYSRALSPGSHNDRLATSAPHIASQAMWNHSTGAVLVPNIPHKPFQKIFTSHSEESVSRAATKTSLERQRELSQSCPQKEAMFSPLNRSVDTTLRTPSPMHISTQSSDALSPPRGIHSPEPQQQKDNVSTPLSPSGSAGSHLESQWYHPNAAVRGDSKQIECIIVQRLQRRDRAQGPQWKDFFAKYHAVRLMAAPPPESQQGLGAALDSRLASVEEELKDSYRKNAAQAEAVLEYRNKSKKQSAENRAMKEQVKELEEEKRYLLRQLNGLLDQVSKLKDGKSEDTMEVAEGGGGGSRTASSATNIVGSREGGGGGESHAKKSFPPDSPMFAIRPLGSSRTDSMSIPES